MNVLGTYLGVQLYQIYGFLDICLKVFFLFLSRWNFWSIWYIAFNYFNNQNIFWRHKIVFVSIFGFEWERLLKINYCLLYFYLTFCQIQWISHLIWLPFVSQTIKRRIETHWNKEWYIGTSTVVQFFVILGARSFLARHEVYGEILETFCITWNELIPSMTKNTDSGSLTT